MINQLRNRLEQRKGQRKQVQDNINKSEGDLNDLKKSLRRLEKAREIIRQVGLKTQEQLSYNISEISSMALNAVLDNPYDLQLEFVTRRNKTECDIWFLRSDSKIDPFDGGGGAVDIAAFALRVASWSIQTPRSRNILILDEPFKHLKGETANRKMLEMVREVSDKLGLQILMISDERVSREATVELTDRLFETSIKRGITSIEKIL